MQIRMNLSSYIIDVDVEQIAIANTSDSGRWLVVRCTTHSIVNCLGKMMSNQCSTGLAFLFLRNLLFARFIVSTDGPVWIVITTRLKGFEKIFIQPNQNVPPWHWIVYATQLHCDGRGRSIMVKRRENLTDLNEYFIQIFHSGKNNKNKYY